MKVEITEDYAYKMGYDAAVNGPNTTNSNFRIFSHPVFTAAWERGNERGKQEHAKRPDKKGR